MTSLIMLVIISRELLREGLGLEAVLMLAPFVFPISLQFSIPATTLYSVCMVFGRMSADGEVATVKAAGISPLMIIQPALVFGMIISPMAVLLGDLAVSWGQPGMDRVLFESIEDVVYRRLEAQHSWSSSKGLSIHVQGVEGRQLLFPVITLHSSGADSEPMTFTASQGKLELDTEQRNLNLKLFDCRVYGDFKGISRGEETFSIPLDRAIKKRTQGVKSPSNIPLRSVSTESAQQRQALTSQRRQLAVESAFAFSSGRWETLANGPGKKLVGEIGAGQSRLYRLQTEPWRRWAAGFSCLAFIAVGVPLAILFRSSDPWTTFGACFGPILLIYYPLFLFGLGEAKDGQLPPYSVWSGNLVLFIIAGVLTRKVWRY
jgi:lipopolysaccharide export system permease protein